MCKLLIPFTEQLPVSLAGMFAEPPADVPVAQRSAPTMQFQESLRFVDKQLTGIRAQSDSSSIE
jgi:hypothetical protein